MSKMPMDLSDDTVADEGMKPCECMDENTAVIQFKDLGDGCGVRVEVLINGHSVEDEGGQNEMERMMSEDSLTPSIAACFSLAQYVGQIKGATQAKE